MGKASYVGRMTSKGQTTVPKAVRDMLGLSEGTQVEWVVEDGRATIKPRTLRAVDLAGFLGKPPSGAPLSMAQIDETIAEAVVERFEQATTRR